MYAQFIEKTLEVMQKANEMYNLNIDLDVRVNVRGTRIAGVAERKLGRYIVRLNPLFCRQHPKDMLEDTIPHEVAHIVAFATKQDDGHGPKWKKIARSLGCSAERTHSLKVIDPKQTHYFVVFPCGTKIDVGAVRYNKIMKGSTFTSKFGRITRDSKFEIVRPNMKAAVAEVKAQAKAITKPSPTNGKVLPKPSKASVACFVETRGDFILFASMLEGKTAQYIKDQFKRCVFHA